MKKLFLFVLLITGAAQISAFAQGMPSDVPEKSAYYKYIDDLVGRGIDVTQGFPDGTFRGSSFTTNYQMAYLVAKLAIIERSQITSEVDFSDVEDEIAWLRQEVDTLQQTPTAQGDFDLHGSVEIMSGIGSVIAYDPLLKQPYGAETDFRLKYTMEKNMGGDANLKVNLDTMDGALDSSQTRDVAKQLLDMEGNISANVGLENPLLIKATMGPGTVTHIDNSGSIPAFNYTVFERPWPSFTVSTLLKGYNLSAGFVARNIDDFGEVSTNEVNFTVGKKLGVLPMIGTTEASYTTRYLSTDLLNPLNGPDDFREELTLDMVHGPDVSSRLMLGASSAQVSNSQYFLGLDMHFKHVNGRGSSLNLYFDSVGTDYRQPFIKNILLPADIFDKLIFDGTVDIALELVQPVSATQVIRARTEWVGDQRWKMGRDIPGSSFTKEIALDQQISDDLHVNVFYRYMQVPSRTNLYGIAVPEFSDVFGIGLKYGF